MARIAAAEGNVAACEDVRDGAVRKLAQLRDPQVQVVFAPAEDNLAEPLRQMASWHEQKLLAGRRGDAEAEGPVVVNDTIYPPNAQAFPGGVYSPGTPSPR